MVSPSRDAIIRKREPAHGVPLSDHLFSVASEKWMPLLQRLSFINAPIGAGLGKPVVLWDVLRREFVTRLHPAQPIWIIRTTARIDIQKRTSHAVHDHLTPRVIDFTHKAALPTTITKRFPLASVELTEGKALPKALSQCPFLHRHADMLAAAASHDDADRDVLFDLFPEVDALVLAARPDFVHGHL